MTDPTSDPSHASFSYETSPQLFLFTSLTAGSSHVITATSRLETILKANKIPFRAIDCATDEKARRIWGRRAGKRKLPGLVREGMVLADMESVEEWNEYGELKERLAEPPVEESEISESNVQTTAGSSVAAADTTPQSQGESLSTPASASQKTLPIRESQPSSRMGTPSHHAEEDITASQPLDLHSTSPSAGLPALHTPPPVRPTRIAFDKPQVSFSGSSIRGASALATPIEGEPITMSAGPAKKSGLAAVLSNPEAAETVDESDKGRGRAKDKDPVLHLDIEPELRAPPAGARVTFEEDQLKGDARDGRAAEDSVGD